VPHLARHKKETNKRQDDTWTCSCAERHESPMSKAKGEQPRKYNDYSTKKTTWGGEKKRVALVLKTENSMNDLEEARKGKA